MYDMLAGKKTAYYFYTRIERILRKQGNPTNETNYTYKGNILPVCFNSQ